VAVAVHGDKIRPTGSMVTGNGLNVNWAVKKWVRYFTKCERQDFESDAGEETDEDK
jgi:hypothetical protein